MSRSHRYPSDLSDAEWIILSPLLPIAPTGGRPRKWPVRTIFDGIFYVLRGGCAWRMLPHAPPPWRTVYHYFRQWRLDGTWEYLNTVLRKRERIRQGRDPQPTACVIDSQSAKATSVGGVCGYDGAKELSRRKRHLLVDVLGLVLRARVHAADAQDRAAVPLLLDDIAAPFPRLVVAPQCGLRHMSLHGYCQSAGSPDGIKPSGEPEKCKRALGMLALPPGR